MSISREEQETIVNYDQAGSTASVYTHNPSLIRKLDGWIGTQDSQVGAFASTVALVKRGDGWAEYSIP